MDPSESDVTQLALMMGIMAPGKEGLVQRSDSRDCTNHSWNISEHVDFGTWTASHFNTTNTHSLLLANNLREANELEVASLLTWKSSLDLESQKLLSSWVVGGSHCNWTGINCNLDGSITSLNLTRYGLQVCSLSSNALMGQIPPEIGNLSMLVNLSLWGNQLYGSIPKELGNLTSLQGLWLNSNNLSGRIPISIWNLQNLKFLYLCTNNLSGQISQEIGSSKMLVELCLSSNALTGKIPPEIGNISMLVNLSLERNQLYGSIPKELGNLTSLQGLWLNSNNLNDRIPISIGNLQNLKFLHLYTNNLLGQIPQEIGLLKMLELSLSSNALTGKIPPEIGNMSMLVNLSLWENQLYGSIPKELGKLRSLEGLWLHSNNLVGQIPFEFNNLTNLRSFQISNNHLTGSLPENLCLGQSLEWIGIGDNNFRGKVPKSLKNCTSLYRLRMDRNEIYGDVSKDFGIYPNLNYIDLSYNNLHGQLSSNWALCPNLTALKIAGNKILGNIPLDLGNAPQLRHLDLSSNQLVGRIPTREEQRDFTNDLFTIWSFDGKMTYESIIEATRNFDSSYCIGVGGVFRAELPSGQIIAVKKFHTLDLQDDGRHDLRSFSNEIKALTNLRHRNIVKLYGFCAHNRHSFLIYEYLQGGSLAQILSDDEKALLLGWFERINEVKAMAKALSLDSSNWTSIAGTMGYTAPEFAYTAEVNCKCDVYSFGVVTLEVIMEKHPGDLITCLSSSSFSAIDGMLFKDLLDPRLPTPKTNVTQQLVLVAKIAVSCMNSNLQYRPTMQQVSMLLSKERDFPNFSPDITLSQLFGLEFPNP
nr:MDIS1-interacting receptor like kinase 2-like [Ipomoea batatas]